MACALAGDLRLERLTVPVFLPGHTAPSAVLRIGQVRQDYQRRGFFRIGVLPVVNAEAVELEVIDGAVWPQASGQLAGLLRRDRPGVPIEVRRFAVRWGGPRPGKLEAGRLGIPRSSAGEWALSGGVVCEAEGRSWSGEVGRVRLAGNEVRIEVRSGGGSAEWVPVDLGKPLREP